MFFSEQIVTRDERNASAAQSRAQEKLKNLNPSLFQDDITGTFIDVNKRLRTQLNADQKSLVAIRNAPFQGMVQVEIELRNGKVKKSLWYANEHSTNTQVLSDVVILPWTHPGLQVAITEDLNEPCDVDDPRYNFIEIVPLSRAKFVKVIPKVIGVYDPGGRVGSLQKESFKTGLKAVKLDMTKDQVKAFVSKMQGILFVTGAPGSGKTTVALQRMRFLFDAGDIATDVEHSPDTCRVFLANQNLVTHTKDLLEKHLDVSSSVLLLVRNFVQDYLEDIWRYKHSALFLYHDQPNNMYRRGREAFFSTCITEALKECWTGYEAQIVERLLNVVDAEWAILKSYSKKGQENVQQLAHKIEKFASFQLSKRRETDPRSSNVNMDHLYNYCGKEYERLRESDDRQDVKLFDSIFLKWLFFIYDPLDALNRYFSNKKHPGAIRIRKGSGARVNEKDVIYQIFSDWEDRRYRREELTWMAWLLRFALPTASDPKDRFREIPNALSPIEGKYGPWSHVVIDEAQDLSVVEASFLSSFVIKKGALTISADFRQVVSPVHGMTDPTAFKVGCNLLSHGQDYNRFPFTKNMRQTGQIGDFLRGFYQNAFGEMPQFLANHDFLGPKPQLHILPLAEFGRTIYRAMNVFKAQKFKGTIALLQVNEDEDEMLYYRRLLENSGVSLAPMWNSDANDGNLITTSVERIKGLEYDICFVVGVESVESSILNYNKNRVYVALSRPTQRLFVLSQNYPQLFRGINDELFDVRSVKS